MDIALIALATAGLILAGVIKGVTGLGYASCALPFLVAAVGLPTAMGLVLAPAMATNVVVLLSGGRLGDTIRRFWPLYVAIAPGMAAGLFAFASVERSVALATLGFVMISYALFALARPHVSLPMKLQAALKVPTGLTTGLLAGLTGSQLMPLIPFVLSCRMDKTETAQAINLAVLIASSFLGVGLAASQLLTADILLWSVAAIAPATLGTLLGDRIRSGLSPDMFRTLVLALLALMGAGMIMPLLSGTLVP